MPKRDFDKQPRKVTLTVEVFVYEDIDVKQAQANCEEALKEEHIKEHFLTLFGTESFFNVSDDLGLNQLKVTIK